MIDYSKLLSKRATALKPSGIRRFFDIAQSVEGVISLGIGEPDFATPWAVRKAAITTLEKGKTVYTANAGLMDLRRAVSHYLEKKIHVTYRPEDQIVLTVGGSEGIDLAIRALVEPGDEVLVPEPSFVCYSPIVSLTGGIPVPIETKREDHFRLTAAALREKITPRTKLLVLPFPNNPTGGVMKREHLEEIAEVLRETNILVLSDEIYSELTYVGEHVSIAEIDGMEERTILVDGFSKTFAMTGWRLGMLAGPEPLIREMLKIHQYAVMCSPTISQYAAIEALTNCRSDVERMRAEYDMRRKFLVTELNRMGLECFEPEGAFYAFPSIKTTGLTSEEFCERLLFDCKVAVVPGSAFGASGEGFIRISYAYSLAHLQEAMKRLEKFLKTL